MQLVQTWIEFFMNNNGGMIFGAIGVALAVGLAGIGSAKGVGLVGGSCFRISYRRARKVRKQVSIRIITRYSRVIRFRYSSVAYTKLAPGMDLATGLVLVGAYQLL